MARMLNKVVDVPCAMIAVFLFPLDEQEEEAQAEYVAKADGADDTEAALEHGFDD